MLLVVPCAGDGSRFWPFGLDLPKCLVPVLGRPLLLRMLDRFVEFFDIDEVIIVASPKNVEAIRNAVSGWRGDIMVSIKIQREKRGVADAVSVAVSQIDKQATPLLVYLGDNYYTYNSLKIIRGELEKSLDYPTIVLAVGKLALEDTYRFGIATCDGASLELMSIIEKPMQRPAVMDRGIVGIVTGLFYFPTINMFTRAFEKIRPSRRGEYEITDVVREVSKNRTVKCILIRRTEWIDISDWRDMIHLVDVALGEEGEKCCIAPTCRISRDVEVENAIIEDRTAILGDGKITNSYILDNCIISMKNSQIDRAVIWRRTTIHIENAKLSGPVMSNLLEIRRIEEKEERYVQESCEACKG